MTGVQTCALPISQKAKRREHKHKIKGGVGREATPRVERRADTRKNNVDGVFEKTRIFEYI